MKILSKLKKKFLTLFKSQVEKFILVGSFTVLIDLTIYSLLIFLNLSVVFSKAVGFISGTVFSFFTNGTFTFNSSTKLKRLIPFFILYSSSLVINVGTNEICLNYFTTFEYAFILSFLIATSLSASFNFLGMKYIIFQNS